MLTRSFCHKNSHRQEVFITFVSFSHISLAILDLWRYFQGMNFDKIPERMIQLGVNRAWLAEQCDYTPDSLRQILAPNGKGKTDKALRRIWEALDREEQRQKTALGISEFLPIRLVLEPEKEQFDRWMRAAYKSHNSFEQWAKQGLDKYAEEDSGLRFVAEDASKYKFPPKPDLPAPYEIPLFRAAAGAPILGDEEMVEVERDYGDGRFLLELRGDSMAPRFQDRQRIVMRHKSALKRPVLKYGELYAFVVDGLVTFKQWVKDKQTGEKVLRSLNPEHADLIADETTDWIGWYDPADNA